MLGGGSKPELPVSHMTLRANNQYTYNHSVPHNLVFHFQYSMQSITYIYIIKLHNKLL